MNNQTLITAVVVVLVGGGSFFGGMQYQQRLAPGATLQTSGRMQGAGGGPGANPAFQMRNGSGSTTTTGMRPVGGEILEIDDTSVTVRLPDGSTKLLLLSDSTKVNKTTEGTRSDLVRGEQINAFGTENPDGSISAQSISLGAGGGMQIRNFGNGAELAPAAN